MNNTPDILKKIIDRKKQEIISNKTLTSLEAMIEKSQTADTPRGFYQALKTKVDCKQNAVIAEIKRASPSKGILRENFHPADIAKSYEENGATCLSVLTDKDFFQGDDEFLIQARNAVKIPVLRKEFIIDAYQVYEARALGADCILLIVACLSDEKLQMLSALSQSLGMDTLVEGHDLTELKRALVLKLPMVGINNRNLRTFEVSLNTTVQLLEEIKDDTLVITESGILSAKDVFFIKQYNIYGYLVGEAFMRAPNPGKALKEIFS
jgi:indole-3-glycerol phosphate synthase